MFYVGTPRLIDLGPVKKDSLKFSKIVFFYFLYVLYFLIRRATSYQLDWKVAAFQDVVWFLVYGQDQDLQHEHIFEEVDTFGNGEQDCW